MKTTMAPSRLFLVAAILVAVVASAAATTYLQDNLEGKWQDRWVQSKFKSDYGKFKLTAGKWYADADASKGLLTSQDARFYAISRLLDTPVDNKDKDLVVQFSVKHEQGIDCGGGYIKLFSGSADLEKFHGGEGETPYSIMFGPDICGSTRKIHTILNYKGTNHLWKKTPRAETDELTHIYTLIIKPDNTYKVLVDASEVASGSLEEDWDLLPPRTIKDPNVSKPSDWVDDATIPDPDAKKPEDWDDEPAEIVDPEAKKPEDWDDELDGEWEPPLIDNPNYKGEWEPPMIPNPAYKGPWVHPIIDNPDFVEDKELYHFSDIGAIGIDVWQVKSGSIFDNFLVTDDVEAALKIAKDLKASLEKEKAMHDEYLEQKKKDDEARAAAAAAAAAEEEEKDDFFETSEEDVVLPPSDEL